MNINLKHIECTCGCFYNAPESYNEIYDEFKMHQRLVFSGLQVDGETPLTQDQIDAMMSNVKNNADAITEYNTFNVVYVKAGNNIIVNIQKDTKDGIIHMDTGDINTSKEFWVTCPQCGAEGYRVQF